MRLSSVLALVVWSAGVVLSAETRKWTSSDGGYSVEAEFVELRDGQVLLKKNDGVQIAVDLDRLSAADQEFVRSQTDPGLGSPDVRAAVNAVHSALGLGDLRSADAQIDAASKLAVTAEDKQLVDRTRSLRDRIQVFWHAVVTGAHRLNSGTEFTIKDTPVIVVEMEGNRLVIRALGQNCRFDISKPETIPSRLAISLASRALPGGNSNPAILSFGTLNLPDNNQALWEAAAGVRLVDVPLPGESESTSTIGPTRPVAPSTAPPVTSFTNPPDQSINDPPSIVRPPATKAPAAEQLAKKRAEIRELFADELKQATGAEQKRALAKKFFDLAGDAIADDAAAGFALYVEAAQLASDAGDAEGAMNIIDRIATSFEGTDLLSLQVAALTNAVKAPFSPQQVTFIADQGMLLIDAAIAADDYDAADQSATAALAAARRLKDRTMQTLLQKRQQEIKTHRTAFARIEAAQELLKQQPDDAAANLIVGVYLCKSRHDWPGGLPHLAKSNADALAAAAKLDLANPDAAAQQFALAEAWWNLTDLKDQPLGDLAKVRAAHWYEVSLAGLSGLNKLKAEKRIEEAAQLTATIAKPGVAEPTTAFLSDLPLAAQENVDLGRRGVLHGAVKINGKEFQHGIWAHPERGAIAKIGYTLDKKYSVLRGAVGMDDSMFFDKSFHAVLFQIFDEKGTLLWTSRPMKNRGDGQAFEVKVKNVETLNLVTRLDGNSNSNAYAVWADLTLLR